MIYVLKTQKYPSSQRAVLWVSFSFNYRRPYFWATFRFEVSWRKHSFPLCQDPQVTHSTSCRSEGQSSLRFVFPSRILHGEPPHQASRVQICTATKPNKPGPSNPLLNTTRCLPSANNQRKYTPLLPLVRCRPQLIGESCHPQNRCAQKLRWEPRGSTERWMEQRCS